MEIGLAGSSLRFTLRLGRCYVCSCVLRIPDVIRILSRVSDLVRRSARCVRKIYRASLALRRSGRAFPSAEARSIVLARATTYCDSFRRGNTRYFQEILPPAFSKGISAGEIKSRTGR